MKVELRSTETIRPYEQNPRLNDQAVEAVAASLREFGFRQPIVVDADGIITRCGRREGTRSGGEACPPAETVHAGGPEEEVVTAKSSAKPEKPPVPTDPSPAAPPRGLECRACGCRHFEVLYTRPRPGGIMRVRQCRHCGRRMITREVPG